MDWEDIEGIKSILTVAAIVSAAIIVPSIGALALVELSPLSPFLGLVSLFCSALLVALYLSVKRRKQRQFDDTGMPFDDRCFPADSIAIIEQMAEARRAKAQRARL